METFTQNVMNTTFYITISNCSIKNWKEKMGHYLHYVDTQWSRFNKGNELASLNELQKGTTVVLSPALFDVLKMADHYRMVTGGLFSPFLKRQMEGNGYDQSFPFSTSATNILLPPFSEKEPLLFRQGNTIIKNTTGEIDLGGIAKGYAVESISQWLKLIGKSSYGLVDGGGDMTLWSDGNKIWNISIADPKNVDRDIGNIKIQNGAIATSNTLYRSWMQGTTKKHHLLNGKTGKSIETDVIQATVLATNNVQAEVAAKMCFLLENPERKEWFKSYLPDVERILVNKNGSIIYERKEMDCHDSCITTT